MDTSKEHAIEFSPAGYRSLEALAAEKGYRFWDSDLQICDTPQEAALLFTCKLNTNQMFKGRKAVLKQRKHGIKKRIVCLTLDELVYFYYFRFLIIILIAVTQTHV